MRSFFFGGSFDPPHAGHLGAANGALASGKAEKILWVPAFAPPHKAGNRHASFADRMMMVRLLTADDPRHEASDFERRIALRPSYSLEVLRMLRRRRPDLAGMLIGADSLLQLHTWHRPEELLDEFEILTYPRPGSEITPEKLFASGWTRKQTERLLSGVLPGTLFALSSTELREGISAGVPAVAEYCRRHRLYSSMLPERNPFKSSVQ